ncbi:hypothetical protein D3C71_2077210 [compost metagenome]
MCKNTADIAAKYGFVDINYKLYYSLRTFNADGYAALISTYHHHITLGEPQLTLLKNGIKDVIKCFGDEINIYDANSLQLARRA